MNKGQTGHVGKCEWSEAAERGWPEGTPAVPLPRGGPGPGWLSLEGSFESPFSQTHPCWLHLSLKEGLPSTFMHKGHSVPSPDLCL